MQHINTSDFIFFSYGLGLKYPWFIENISTYEECEKNAIIVKISFNEASSFNCPACGRTCTIEKCTEKIWRHINFFDKKCFLSVKVPQLKCREGDYLQYSTIFGSLYSDYTYLLEEKIFINSQFAPIKKISQYLDIPENELWSSVLKSAGAGGNIGQIYAINDMTINEADRSLL